MRKGTSGHEATGGAESLEDLVYRPRLATDNAEIRNANPLITIPATLLGYLLLGFLGWKLVQHSRALIKEIPRNVIVDLQDLSEGEAPQPAAPAPPPAAGGPPPGAIEKADAPPPPIPATTDAIPEKPPEELPTQDLSGVAFPVSATPGPGGTGTGPGVGGTGEGTGPSATGTGQGTKVVDYEFSQIRIKYRPELSDANYPRLARMARIQGTVKVEITVGVDGVPVSSRAVEGPLQLRSGAETIAMQYRFQPETQNGVPVLARFVLNVVFRLN